MTEFASPARGETICAILVGKAPDQNKARSLVLASESCPYVALYTAKEDTIIAVFTLPKSQSNWIAYPDVKPKFLELEPIATILTEQIQASSPWSRGEVKPEAYETPCQKRCDKCPRYRTSCDGCPATIFYFAAE